MHRQRWVQVLTTASLAILVAAPAMGQSPGTSVSPAASPGTSPCPPSLSPGPIDPSASADPSLSASPDAGGPVVSIGPSSSPIPIGSAPVPASPAADDGCAAVALVLTIATTQEQPLAFTENVLTAPASTRVRLEYLNDSNVPHNITLFQGPDASAPRIASTDLGTGPADLQVVEFTTPAEPGSYFFHCDVHPTLMTGTFEVT